MMKSHFFRPLLVASRLPLDALQSRQAGRNYCRRPLLAFLCAPILVGLSGTVAQARDYYLSPSGNDSTGDGSISRPFFTLTKAARSATVPGDRVFLRGGTYYYSGDQSISSSGTASSRITFQPYGTERPILRVTGATFNAVSIYGSFITFKGIELAQSNAAGIITYDANDIRIENCTAYNVRNWGIRCAGSTPDQNYNNVIVNSVAYDCARDNVNRDLSAWPAGLGITDGRNCQVTGCTAYRNYGEGIQVGRSEGCYVARSTAYDNFSINFYLDNSRNTTIERSFSYTTGNSGYFRGGQPAAGIGLANEQSLSSSIPGRYYLSNVSIRNNIVVGGAKCIQYNQFNGNMDNVRIRGNTFYGGYYNTIEFGSNQSVTHSNVQVQNNIFNQSRSDGNYYSIYGGSLSGRGITASHNCFYGSTRSIFGSSNITTNPQLSVPGGNSSSNYRISSTSPCRNAGNSGSTITSELTQDYFGGSRTSLLDIGAHEVGG
jgi:parallel beta-helix repeat protein